MARCYVEDLTAGQRLADQVFLISSKDLRTASNGSHYIHLVLADRTGHMPGRMWQATEEDFKQMPESDLLRFTGHCESYRGNLQFIVEGYRPVEPGAQDLADFVPSTSGDVKKMWAEVKSILRTISHRDLLELIKEFVTDKDFVDRFTSAPAAQQRHHAYMGGLLEHTLSVMRLAQAVCPMYPSLNQDLMLAGAFLHDIGKIAELESGAAFGYTTDGQLVGHIVRSVVWVEEKVRAVESRTGRPFPEELKQVLQHILVAHHGELQFGSPKVPSVAEAFALHYLDNLDAKLHQVFKHIEADPDATSDWTGYVHALQTRLFKKDVTADEES